MAKFETILLPPHADPVEWVVPRIPSNRTAVWIAPHGIVADDWRTRHAGRDLTIVTIDSRPEGERVPLLIVSRLLSGEAVDSWIDRSDHVIRLVGPYDDPQSTTKPSASTSSSVPPPPRLIRHEAAGRLGECRLAARQIRMWIDAGIAPASILVTCRDPDRLRPDLIESMSDVGLPLATFSKSTWVRSPAVSTLLRALQLPLQDFAFGDVVALLRSSHRKTSSEIESRNAAMTLRLLGRTRGKIQYLDALDEWAIAPPLPLEDEEVDRPHRERLGRYARQMRGFLTRWFAIWDLLPAAARPTAWIAAVRSLAGDLLNHDPAIHAFLTHCESGDRDDSATWTLTDAVAWFTAQASSTTDSPGSAVAGSVRLVAAEVARHLPCDALAILDLREGTFPKVGMTTDDDVRRERLLFHDLLRRPTRELLLSFASTDDAGDPMLPAEFVTATLRMRQLDRTPPDFKQSMLLDRFAEGPAYSQTERRIQAARRLRANASDLLPGSGMTESQIQALHRARDLAGQRFETATFTAFDGWLAEPPVLRRVEAMFPPEKPFSASSLETYVDCPFKFWMNKVLGISETVQPGDDLEAWMRGRAIHRGLLRHHRDSQPDLAEAFADAVEEYRGRSASALQRVLWELESQRMARTARRYVRQAEKRREKNDKLGLVPRPYLFEESFGGRAAPLVLEHEGESVRLVGTIDRVDIAEDEDGLVFWVIDYKTGAKRSFTSKAVKDLRVLQLPVYAIVAERKLGDERRSARPKGLIYWLLGQSEGAKDVAPNPFDWPQLRRSVSEKIIGIVRDIRSGRYPLMPADDDCTSQCDYATACRIAQLRSLEKTSKPAPPAP